MWTIWDKKSEINGFSAEAFLARHKHLANEATIFLKSFNGRVVEVEGNVVKVKVGEVEHPMISEHYIMWVALIKDDMIVKVSLHPETIPEVKLPYISGSEIYAYCNLHGLWKSTVE